MSAEKRADHLRLVPRDAPPLPDEELPGKELERIVYDTEIVEEPAIPSQEVAVRRPGTLVRVQPSEAAVKVARVLKAEAVTVAHGWHSWLARAWDALTLGVYRKQIRIAAATSNQEALALWQDRKEQAVQRRRDRILELPKLGLSILKVAASAIALLLVLIPLIALLVWMTGGNGFDVFRWVGGLIRFAFDAIAFLWVPALAGGGVALLVASRREGRRENQNDDPVAGKRSADGRGDASSKDVIPDESAVLQALRHLELAPLNKAFKAGWRPRWVLPTERDGNGYHSQLELPMSVTVEMIVEKKKTLAHNLSRFPIEVWPTEPRTMPGVLDLWVADQGALSGPVPDWPLLHEGATDYFASVPCAVDIRRRPINGRLFEANYAIAGMMGSGKSSLIITLLLGALLDPLVDADVFCMADNADYDPMAPRLRTLRTGTGEDVAEHCLATMNDIYDELSVRGKALKEHGVRAASRALAEKDERLRPRVIVVDECQALFLHEKFGQKALEIAVKTENAARKYAVTIVYATPEASSDSLPRRLIAITSNKACFAIGDQTSNDAILGTGSYKAGISAVGLEPKTDESLGDVGTFMGRGFTPKPSLLRSYFVSQSQAVPVVQRALQIREKAGYGSASASLQARDLLDDLDEVLGSDRTRVSDLPSRLRRLAPNWLPYQNLNGIELKDVLTRKYGVRVTNPHNVLHLDPADLRRVRDQREAGE